MILSEHKDLKYAITSLPAKEKDKLLLRLIAKDKILTENLHFQLLEDASDLEARRLALSELIEENISELNASSRFNVKDTLLLLRTLNGKINHHYKVTKDLNSEIELRMQLLNQIPLTLTASVHATLSKYNDRMVLYFLRTTLSVYKKYLKLHEDLQFDLQDNLNKLLKKAYTSRFAETAEALGLPESL
jgi:hypothetical protein